MTADSVPVVPLESPRITIVRMVVFTLVVAILAVVLLPSIYAAFMANVFLNSLIIVTLLLGIVYAFSMVFRLFRELKWLNGFRAGLLAHEVSASPVLLAPMASLLGNARGGGLLSTNSLRSLLDSMASRLDESRDLLRYLVGLLIFLGLLGTFWGLLETVGSVGAAIQNLDVTAGQSNSMFAELKAGLQRPLAGMGLSFSSSLFGLAGSLILGFYDLQAASAQNRFYHNVEDWLASITDIQAGEGQAATSTAHLRLDILRLEKGLDRLTQQIEGLRLGETLRPAAHVEGAQVKSNAIEDLADAVAGLVQQMREEQKLVRQWTQAQQVQQTEIHRLLLKATDAQPIRGRQPDGGG